MELSLNGNPNANENHGTVLRGTFLTSLSLRFCKISAKGLKAICDELSSDSNQTLIYLNLSSNSVGDEGVEMIADALRVNRQLSFLNLADNQIGDDGCVVLMRVCMKFPLVLDEIIVRRQIVIRNIFKKYVI